MLRIKVTWMLPVLILLAIADCVFGNSCPRGVVLTPDLMAQYQRVMQCTGITAPAPRVVWYETGPCPTSGIMRCIKGREPYRCPWDKTALCGDAGSYDPECQVIEMPDKAPGVFAHEVIHYLLHQKTGDADHDHKSQLYKCENPSP